MSKFKTGPAHIFNPVPENDEEALAHGNALAKSGNYPVGTSGCFNVGISGGCGVDCFVYLNGDCEGPQEMLNGDGLTPEQLAVHNELYQKDYFEEEKLQWKLFNDIKTRVCVNIVTCGDCGNVLLHKIHYQNGTGRNVV